MNQTKTYSIGRDQDNDLVIPNQYSNESIGRQHAFFNIQNRGEVIEVQAKKKGYKVYVNGFRVYRKQIQISDNIQFGNKYLFELRHYFRINKHLQIIGTRNDLNDFTDDFLILKESWDENKRKEAVLNGPFNMNLKTTDFFILIICIGIVVQIPLISWGSILITLTLTPFLRNKNVNAIKDLKQKMELENICPKCRHFFKKESWDTIYKKGGHECGARWN